DCLYDQYTSNELKTVVTLTDEEEKIVSAHKPVIYLFFAHSTRVFADYNTSLNVRANVDILKAGIQIAANNMPQGEVIQIPLNRNIGRQNQVHFVAHFENCKSDLGRKGFQKDV